MTLSYVGDNPREPPSQGTVVELRQTQAVIQDSVTRRRWGVQYAAINHGYGEWSGSRRAGVTADTTQNETRRVRHR
jgi:hypothetical protein